MPGRALITGGAGFIGSHLAEHLLEQDWEVFVLDDLSTGAHRNVEVLRDHAGFHLVVDSVLSPSVVSELVYKCDVVFHLAAAVGVRLIVEQPVHTMVTNLQGTTTVLEYCNKFDKRVVIASSSEVYGDHREERPLEENDRRVYGPVTERRWLYADSKAMDEFLALGFHQERGLDCVIARFFNTVGPRQSGQYGMVIPRFVERAVSGAPLEVHGDGMQTRSFCHVSDTVARDGLADGRARDLGRDLQHRLVGARAHRRSRAPRPRADRIEVRVDVRPSLGGLRPRNRGRPAPRAVDREDPRGDRLAAVTRPRPGPRRRDRLHATRSGRRPRLEPRRAISTGVPSGSSRASMVIPALLMRMQPWLTFVPSLPGSFVPCRPIWPGPPPNVVRTFENADSPKVYCPYTPLGFGCFSNSTMK